MSMIILYKPLKDTDYNYLTFKYLNTYLSRSYN